MNEQTEVLNKKTLVKVKVHYLKDHNRYYCPICEYYMGYIGTTITNTRILRENYCPHCGQALDWSGKHEQKKTDT